MLFVFRHHLTLSFVWCQLLFQNEGLSMSLSVHHVNVMKRNFFLSTVMINNSTNINNTKNYLSPQIIQQKKKILTYVDGKPHPGL